MDEDPPAFPQEKAIASALYLARRLPRPAAMSIAILLYCADKTRLERYGRAISADRYIALPQCAVPARTYALLRPAEIYSAHGFKLVDGHFIEAIDAPDLGQLSGGELAILDETIARSGDAPLWYLQQLSQDRAWRQARRGASAAADAGPPSFGEADVLDAIFGAGRWPAFIREQRENL